jgi:hypothetical protein
MRLIHAPAVVAERGVAVDRCAVVTLGRESAERDDTRLPCTSVSHPVGADVVTAYREEELSDPSARDGRLSGEAVVPAAAGLATPSGRLHSSGTGVVEPDADASYVAKGIAAAPVR